MDASVTDCSQIWALSDGRAGNARQALALAEAVAAIGGESVREPVLQPRAPWAWLAPRLMPPGNLAFGRELATASSQLPRLAIGCGRQAALVTRWLRGRVLRQTQDERVKTVQILDPRIDPAHWDLVVAPQHDRLSGANVIATLGGLNPVDDAWLAQARDEFAAFAALPQPRTTVLLGGGSRHARFDRMAFEVLASKLEVALARDGGSVLLSTSRRTPRELVDVLAHRYDETPGSIWRGAPDPCHAHVRSQRNPYPGLLAFADRIVCSPDSVNMISEACATRVPVHVFDPGRVRGRPRRFLDALLASGRIRAMDAQLQAFDVEPLRETARVAALVRERLL